MKKFAKTLSLLGAFLLIAANAWALPMAGDDVVMTRGTYGTGPGGEFDMTVSDSSVFPGTIGDAYVAFCVEIDEYISMGSTYVVQSVVDYATHGGNDNGDDGVANQDPLSEDSRRLYASYMNGAFDSGVFSHELANRVQNAFWYLEDEIEESADWDSLSSIITDTTAAGWDIKVVNLVTQQGLPAQSQIVGAAAPVPEPATMLLLGTGLIGMAGMRRRQIKK